METSNTKENAEEFIDYITALQDSGNGHTPSDFIESGAYVYLTRWERVKVAIKIIIS